MNKKQRFHATVGLKPVDCPTAWLGIQAASAMPALLDYFIAPENIRALFAATHEK